MTLQASAAATPCRGGSPRPPAGTSNRHFVFTEKFPLHAPFQRFEHVRRRPMKAWREVLEGNGLEFVRIRPAFVFMDNAITCGHHSLLGHLASLQWRVVSKCLRLTTRWPIIQIALI